MTLVHAINVLFGKIQGSGQFFEKAFNVLKGKNDSDLSPTDVATLDELAETFQDFVGDPAEWLKRVSVADPRHAWWVKLALALGASLSAASGGSSASAVSVKPLADQPTPEIEPELGIDPDALASGAPPPNRREGVGNTGGGGFSISTGDVDDPPRREKRKRKGRDRDEDEEDRDDDRPPERQVRRPPQSSVTKNVAPRIIAILVTDVFSGHRERILAVFRSIREGDSDAQDELVQLERELRAIVRSMPTGYLVMASAELALDMMHSLRAGKDQSDPAWFQANYVTGSYS